MPVIDIVLDGDGCWPELQHLDVIDLMGDRAPVLGLSLLPGGMTSGKSSVTLRIPLPDGRVLLTETSLELLAGAVRAFIVRLGSLGYNTSDLRRPIR